MIQISQCRNWKDLMTVYGAPHCAHEFKGSSCSYNEELTSDMLHVISKCYYSTSRALSCGSMLDVDCLRLYLLFIQHDLFPSLSCKNASWQKFFLSKGSMDTFQILI